MTTPTVTPTCGSCPTPVSHDTAVFFELTRPIREFPAGYAVACVPCAVLILRRDVQGLMARWPGRWASYAVQSEATALTLRFVDSAGPALDFGDWWLARHPDIADA